MQADASKLLSQAPFNQFLYVLHNRLAINQFWSIDASDWQYMAYDSVSNNNHT